MTLDAYIDNVMNMIENATGLEVVRDIYMGSADSFICYTLEDEIPVFWGDNHTLADTASVQVSLYTLPNIRFSETKAQIREILEQYGIVTGFRSYLDEYVKTGNKMAQIRHSVFSVDFTKERSN